MYKDYIFIIIWEMIIFFLICLSDLKRYLTETLQAQQANLGYKLINRGVMFFFYFWRKFLS